MQACPYDALYIDPNSNTAAKCNYCAHRTEQGLEPACVVVCPVHAIVSGDMHNPKTEIAQLIAREPVRVRKPEQGTKPNVYYLGADEATINPEAATQELPHMTMWSTMLRPHHEDERTFDPTVSLRTYDNAHETPRFSEPRISLQNGSAGSKPVTLNPLKPYQPAGDPAKAHIVYDTPKNSAPWGWMVSAYLGTKSIGAGAMIVAALAVALYGLHGSLGGSLNALLGIAAPIIGGLFIAATLVLLVADLKRPERAIFLLTKANPTSWLVWGGYILGLFGLLEALWFGSAVLGLYGVLHVLLIPSALFGAAAAGYTAFLFGQAEGRDFWQSPLLLPILLVQSVLAGSAMLGIFALLLGATSAISTLLVITLLSSVGVHLMLILLEVFGSHSNSHVTAAAHYITGGPLRTIFRGLFLVLGTLVPLVLLIVALLIPVAQPALLALAGVVALIGLFAYEHCFVVAGQSVALS
ncbi:MAG: polysulfide reductase NrfD [Ktedonobacteraceae bacterium]